MDAAIKKGLLFLLIGFLLWLLVTDPGGSAQMVKDGGGRLVGAIGDLFEALGRFVRAL